MEYLHKFETQAQCDAYVNSENYKEPFTAYIEENGGISYNKPSMPQHDYVEIGGVKWATMNLGATAVTDYGKYYAWGETQGYTAEQITGATPEKAFNGQDYKYGDCDWVGPDYGMTKYNNTDGLITLQPIDDAVTQEWGGNWRIPTNTEWTSLIDAVNTAWTTDYQGSGVAGIICTDKTDSTNVLFLPSAGEFYNGRLSSSSGAFLSSILITPYAIDYGEASEYGLVVGGVDGFTRCKGMSVRGILDE